MAVDMLENNDLSALSPSRLGNKNFIDDIEMSGGKVYKNMSQQEEFSNLFGSKNRKKLVSKVKGKWSNLNTDCSNVDSNIALIEEDTAALIKRSATEKGYNLKSTKLVIQENQTALGDLKKFKALECTKLEAETKALEEKKFEEKLIALSDATVEKAKSETKNSGGVSGVLSNIGDSLKKVNKNVFYIGGGVIVLGIISYFIFRKK
ncbi:MAG: hypothetical protein ACOVNU_09100 [Candidatus Kapaibacteriota bacterium]